jgi:hypothetical protein
METSQDEGKISKNTKYYIFVVTAEPGISMGGDQENRLQAPRFSFPSCLA